ncbi:MurR/RpiR family transcriptional regulator [Bacillus sp. T33-2]|uniref:MurR/RpiR family transcriptional regulator n=1 Tax=Bacillus sp. T33-2 TaxID=2054168 RepID=UPI000C76CBF2|nr:MurR/RpiR family transcriptional regulator [Bacillus sp. T33-2]PLR95941.1 MurR/RpiR family transcriptional regulator [Bacillus sp. T33-2]
MLFNERVHKFEYKLNDTDDQIIEFINQNKREAVNMSIQSLAACLFTVPNTITRLSKKLGYDGFSQLKNNLKEELAKQQGVQDEEDSMHFNLNKTFSLIDGEKMESVVKLILQAKKVLFFGVGDTVSFCEMMVQNLRVAGKEADFHLHRHEAIYELNRLDDHDLLFLISLSGETPLVLEMANIALNKGIKVISVTHFNRNSLEKTADVSLYCYSPRKTLNGYNITDRTPLMLVLRALSEYYWERADCV